MNDGETDELEAIQLKGLKPNPKVTRRLFAAGGSLGAGFALAVQPVSAQTIITDAEGLTAGDIKVQVEGRAMPAYRARPAGKTGEAVVLVVHEVFGLHEHIKDLCRRLAKQGYYAIAPDMFSPYGDATKIADVQQLIRDIVSRLGDAEVYADLDACVRYAGGDKADTRKLAVTGFCWGGRIVWMYTAHNPAVRAGAAWYGPLAPASAGADAPITEAPQIKGRVLGFYGGQDTGITAAHVQAMREALITSGDTKTVINVYPNSPHAFNADYRASYREADAKDAWAKMLAWFKSNGVA